MQQQFHTLVNIHGKHSHVQFPPGAISSLFFFGQRTLKAHKHSLSLALPVLRMRTYTHTQTVSFSSITSSWCQVTPMDESLAMSMTSLQHFNPFPLQEDFLPFLSSLQWKCPNGFFMPGRFLPECLNTFKEKIFA